MDRVTRLLGTVNRSQQILEIGPGYSPVAPKAGGWQTHVVDHATRDELRAKYAPANVETDLIEDVDTIWRDGALRKAVPADLLNRVDLIIASHVLEHIPNLVGFLQSASQLVRLGGSLSVALPDRRYCFDCFRPWTTTGALMLELAATGISDWEVTELHGPENFEFFVIIRRGGLPRMDPVSLQVERQRLLLAQLVETQEQINFILGTAEATAAGKIDAHAELVAKVADHDRRLQELSETLAWLSTALGSVRRAWRTFRGSGSSRNWG